MSLTLAAPLPVGPRPPAFLSRFIYEEVEDESTDGRGTFVLFAPLVYYSAVLGREVTVPADFKTDFASVPRIPVAYLLFGGRGNKAAAVHDWLYTTQETTREEADAVLREALVAAGVPAWRAALMYAGVRVGGASHWPAPGQPQATHVEAAIQEAQRQAA